MKFNRNISFVIKLLKSLNKQHTMAFSDRMIMFRSHNINVGSNLLLYSKCDMDLEITCLNDVVVNWYHLWLTMLISIMQKFYLLNLSFAHIKSYLPFILIVRHKFICSYYVFHTFDLKTVIEWFFTFILKIRKDELILSSCHFK